MSALVSDEPTAEVTGEDLQRVKKAVEDILRGTTNQLSQR